MEHDTGLVLPPPDVDLTFCAYGKHRAAETDMIATWNGQNYALVCKWHHADYLAVLRIWDQWHLLSGFALEAMGHRP